MAKRLNAWGPEPGHIGRNEPLHRNGRNQPGRRRRYPNALTSSGFPSVAATQEVSFRRKSSEKRLLAKLVWTSTKGIVGPLLVLVSENRLLEKWREREREEARSDTGNFLLV